MGWEPVFGDAKAPESARGILAECVLENVRPTGNKGLPLTILQVGGELREQGVGGNRGPVCKGLGVRGFMHTEGNSWRARQGGYMCKGGGWVPGYGYLKQRVSVQSGGAPCEREMFAGKMCVQRRDVEPTRGTNKENGG